MIQENKKSTEEVSFGPNQAGLGPIEEKPQGSLEMVVQLEDQAKRILMLRRMLVEKSLSTDFVAWRNSNGIETNQAALQRLDDLVVDELAIALGFDTSTDPQERWTAYMNQISRQGLLAELLNSKHKFINTPKDQLRQLSRAEI